MTPPRNKTLSFASPFANTFMLSLLGGLACPLVGRQPPNDRAQGCDVSGNALDFFWKYPKPDNARTRKLGFRVWRFHSGACRAPIAVRWPADTSYAKAFDLLVTLVRRSGHLVSKDDLLRAVWPDTIVEEVNLTVNISALRKALGRRCSAHYIRWRMSTTGAGRGLRPCFATR
jgi:hypothetical protein